MVRRSHTITLGQILLAVALGDSKCSIRKKLRDTISGETSSLMKIKPLLMLTLTRMADNKTIYGLLEIFLIETRR